MANNPIKSASRTPKEQYQTSENDSVNWNQEGKMATKFYNLKKTPQKDRCTSGAYAYGDSDLDMLK